MQQPQKNKIFIFKPYKVILIITAVLLFGLFSVLGANVFKEYLANVQMEPLLQSLIQDTGLTVKIGHTSTQGWNRLVLTDVILEDQQNKVIPCRIQEINIDFNLWAILKNPKNPESVLEQIEFVAPDIQVQRFADGTWNFVRYLQFKPVVLNLKLNLLFRLQNGRIQIRDRQIGFRELTGIHGQARLDFPVLDLTLEGKANMGLKASMQIGGKVRFDHFSGEGNISWRQWAIPQVVALANRLSPGAVPGKFRDGYMDGTGLFDWDENSFRFYRGEVTIAAASYQPQGFPGPVTLKKLEAELTPERILLKKAEVAYHKTTVGIVGEINPRTSAVNVDIRVSRLELRDWDFLTKDWGGVDLDGAVDARLHWSGAISNPLLNGKVHLQQVEIAIADERVNQITGELTVTQNQLAVSQLEGRWREGAVRITGVLGDIFHPFLNLEIYGSGLNLNPYLEMTGITGVNIGKNTDIRGKISGYPPDLKCEGDLYSSRVRIQALEVSDLRAKLWGDLSTQSLTLSELSGGLPNGWFFTKGELKVELATQKLTWAMETGVTNLPLELLLEGVAEPDIKGRLSLNAFLRGSWSVTAPFEPGLVLGQFSSPEMVVDGTKITGINGVFSWDSGGLTVDSLEANLGGGKAFATLSWDQKTLRAGVIGQDIKISQVFPKPQIPVDGVFSGRLTVEGPITDLKGLLNGSMTGMSWAGRPLGDIHGVISYADEKVRLEDVWLSAPFGVFRVQGNVASLQEPVFGLQIVGENLDLAEMKQWLGMGTELLPVLPDISGFGNMELAVEGTMAAHTFTGKVQFTDPKLAMVRMEEGVVRFHGNPKVITVSECSFRKGKARLGLVGSLEQEKLDFNINAEAFDLQMLNLNWDKHELSGTVGMKGRLVGTIKNPVLSVAISGNNLRLGTLGFQKMSGELVWKNAELAFDKIKLLQPGEEMELTGKARLDDKMTFDLDARVAEVRLEPIIRFFRLSSLADMTGKISGNLKLSGNLNPLSIQSIGTVSAGLLNTVPFTGDFLVNYKPEMLNIRSLRLKHENGTFVGSGAWEKEEFKASIAFKNFQLQPVSALVKTLPKLDGILTSNINLEWTKGNVTGDYHINISDMAVSENHLGNFFLKGNFNRQGMSIKESLLIDKKGSITGFIPWPKSLVSQFKLPVDSSQKPAKLDVNIMLPHLSGTVIGRYFPQAPVIDGGIDGKFRVSGSLEEPKISGKLDLIDLKAVVPGLPFPVEAFQATVIVESSKAELQNARGIYGGSKFGLSGTLDLTDMEKPRFDLGFIGKRIYYKNPYFDGYGDLDLRFAGALDDMLLSGSIALNDCKAGILTFVPPEAGEPFTFNPKLDVLAKAGSNVRCRVIGLVDLYDLGGEVRVQGSLLAPVMEGTIGSNNGLFTFYSQTFQVNEAKSTFRYSQGFRPYLDVNASTFRSGYEISLQIKGMIDEFRYEVTSQPYCSQAELFAMLNWSELRGDQPFTVDGVTKNLSLVTDTVLGDFFYELRKALSVDYLYLDIGQNDFRIHVGDYITRNLFLSYSRSVINDPNDSWTLDYHVLPGLALGGSYSPGLGTSWRLLYQTRF